MSARKTSSQDNFGDCMHILQNMTEPTKHINPARHLVCGKVEHPEQQRYYPEIHTVQELSMMS